MGIFSGLKGLGLGNMENRDLYSDKEDAKAAPETPKAAEKTEQKSTTLQESSFIFDKGFECPVCNSKFTSKILKANRARMIGMDRDLRGKYEGVDPVKYDVVMCPECGYAALGKYFPGITGTQAKLIREQITTTIQFGEYKGDIYTYEQALERYQIALACAVVKRAKSSEKAYTCLKAGWATRGWIEAVTAKKKAEPSLITMLKKQEDEYLQNAYTGFSEARMKESLPVCGMDAYTLDYLLAVLAIRFGDLTVAERYISNVLSSNTANSRVKDKARDLKQVLQEERKKG